MPPAIIKSLFTKFPLETYPSIPPPPITGRKWSLKLESDSKNGFFSLGVYNLFRLDGRLLASDPCCLFAQLHICEKNGAEIVEYDPQITFSIMELSYQASQDLQLPILVETTPDVKNNLFKRVVRANYTINELIMTEIDEEAVYLVVSLMDRVFYDVWILTILMEMSPGKVASLYGLGDGVLDIESFDKIPDSPGFLENLVFKDLVVNLLKRNQFDKRYPVISENFHSYAPNFFVLHGKPQRLGGEIEGIYSDFLSFLESFQGISQQVRSHKLFKQKLQSYTVLMKTFMKNTRGWELVEKSGVASFV